MLVNRPMVVCYRLSGMTHAMAKWLRLVKSRYFALPNILAGECLVPELLQDAVTGPGIAEAAVEWLERAELRARLSQRFTTLHETLRVDAAEQAADAVMRHVSGDGV